MAKVSVGKGANMTDVAQEEDKMKLPDFSKNRGVKMTFAGFIASSLLRIALCFIPEVPQEVADKMYFGTLALFGGNVLGQKFADGVSKGATSTVKDKDLLN